MAGDGGGAGVEPVSWLVEAPSGGNVGRFWKGMSGNVPVDGLGREFL